ncbi:S8 family serine peptidase [Alkalihalobacillus sp. R86527]|uniref:S8 family serine peptidase n=1 Tax=Alkalihalobacillus sp. R86527 TaxID=3093863 RepID=UPI003672414C
MFQNDSSRFSGQDYLSHNFSTSFTAEDMNGHGTHVAGIAAATTTNDLGVAGQGARQIITPSLSAII